MINTTALVGIYSPAIHYSVPRMYAFTRYNLTTAFMCKVGSILGGKIMILSWPLGDLDCQAIEKRMSIDEFVGVMYSTPKIKKVEEVRYHLFNIIFMHHTILKSRLQGSSLLTHVVCLHVKLLN